MFTTATITNDSFEQVMRSLAQRRAQGILSIEVAPARYGVHFHAGRVIHVAVEGVDLASRVREMVSAAREEPWRGEGVTVQELYAATPPSPERDLLVRAHREIMLDLLVALDIAVPARAQFSQGMILPFGEDAPTIAPAAVLLERQAFRADQVRAATLFPPDCMISRTAESIPSDTAVEDEVVALTVLGSEPLAPYQLAAKGVLGQVHLQTVLLALHERGAIEVLNAPLPEEERSSKEGPEAPPTTVPVSEPAPTEASAPSVGVSTPRLAKSPSAAPTLSLAAVGEIIAGGIVLAGIALPYLLWRDIFTMFRS